MVCILAIKGFLTWQDHRGGLKLHRMHKGISVQHATGQAHSSIVHGKFPAFAFQRLPWEAISARLSCFVLLWDYRRGWTVPGGNPRQGNVGRKQTSQGNTSLVSTEQWSNMQHEEWFLQRLKLKKIVQSDRRNELRRP